MASVENLNIWSMFEIEASRLYWVVGVHHSPLPFFMSETEPWSWDWLKRCIKQLKYHNQLLHWFYAPKLSTGKIILHHSTFKLWEISDFIQFNMNIVRTVYIQATSVYACSLNIQGKWFPPAFCLMLNGVFLYLFASSHTIGRAQADCFLRHLSSFCISSSCRGIHVLCFPRSERFQRWATQMFRCGFAS